MKHSVKRYLGGFGRLGVLPFVQQIGPSYHLVEAGVTHSAEILSELACDEAEIGFKMLFFTLEPAHSFLVLGCNSYGAGVFVAVAAHNAAQAHQRCGAEAVLLRAQKSHEQHVSGCLQTSVHLYLDLGAQVVHHKSLLNLREACLRGTSAVLYRACGAGSRASVRTAYKDYVRLCLCNSGSNGAHPGLGHEFDAYPGCGIDVAKVIYQLREVFDRVDVVMGRRRNQGDAGNRVPGLGYQRVDLEPGQLSPFAGLCSLSHFYLYFVSIYQIFGIDSEAAGRYLLDGAAHRVPVGQGSVP